MSEFYIPVNDNSTSELIYFMNKSASGEIESDGASYSSCPNFTGEEHKLSAGEQTLVIIMYSLIALLGIGGNSLVLFIVIHFRRMHSATNYFIANLAVSDILMATVCIPFTYWHILILQYWPFGWFLCKLISTCQTLAVMLSAHTLIVISIDRFSSIMFPLRHNVSITGRRAIFIIICVWIIDFIIALPIAFVQTTLPDEYNPNLTQCNEIWWFDDQAFYYSQATMILQYFLPILMLIVTYASIAIKLWVNKPVGESTKTAERSKKEFMKKLTKMMIIVSVMYTICWLPTNILTILWTMCPSYQEHPYILLIYWACHFLAMSHSMVNPIIYGFKHQKFSDGFRFVFRWVPGVNYSPAQSSLTRTVRYMITNRSKYHSVPQNLNHFKTSE